MRNVVLVLILVALVLIASCGPSSPGRVSAVLDDVEVYINERPDSALAVLEGVDSEALRTRALRARYALLLSMALDKNYIDLRSDSILAPAVSWYSRYGRSEERMKTFYYLGRIKENDHNYKDAIVAYTRAEENASRCKEDLFSGMISMAIAKSYQATYNHDQALKYQEKGKECFMNAGDTIKYYMAVGYQAMAMQAKKEWNQADSLYQLALSHTTREKAAQALFLSNYALLKVLQPHPDAEKAISLLSTKTNEYQIPLSPEDYAIYSYSLALKNRYEEATAILDRISLQSPNHVDFDYWWYRIMLLKADYEHAILYLNQSYLKNDLILERVLSESLPESMRRYYETRADEEKRNHANTIKSILVVLLLLVSAGALLINRQRARSKQLEEQLSALAPLGDSLRKLSAESQKKQEIINDLQVRYVKLFKKQFELLESLCAAYWSPVKKSEKDKIYEEVQKILGVINCASGRGDKLEEMLNDRLDNIMVKIRLDLPSLGEQNYRLIAFSLLGFQSKTIAAIMGYTEASVNTKKSRIRRAITELNCGSKELYLRYL